MFIQLWMILAFLSAITAAIKNIISKKILNDNNNISAKQVLFQQEFVILAIILILFIPLVNFSIFYSIPLIFFAKGIILGLTSILHLDTLKKYEISTVIPLMNLSPLFLILFSWILLSEMLSILQILGIIIIIIGTYILELHSNHKHDKPHLNHFKDLKNLFSKSNDFYIRIFVLLILLSLSAVFEKMLFNKGVDIITNLYFTAAIILGFLSIHFLYKKMLVSSIKKIIQEPKTLFITFFGLLDKGTILFALSQPTALVSLIIPIRRTSTFFSVFFGGLLFHEKHLKEKIIACIIMIVGVIIISIT